MSGLLVIKNDEEEIKKILNNVKNEGKLDIKNLWNIINSKVDKEENKILTDINFSQELCTKLTQQAEIIDLKSKSLSELTALKDIKNNTLYLVSIKDRSNQFKDLINKYFMVVSTDINNQNIYQYFLNVASGKTYFRQKVNSSTSTWTDIVLIKLQGEDISNNVITLDNLVESLRTTINSIDNKVDKDGNKVLSDVNFSTELRNQITQNTTSIENLEIQVQDLSEGVGSESFTEALSSKKEVGGIWVGYSLKDKSVKEVLTDLLCPLILSTIKLNSIHGYSNSINYINAFGNYTASNVANIQYTKNDYEINKIELFEGSTILYTKADGFGDSGTLNFSGFTSSGLPSGTNSFKYTLKATCSANGVTKTIEATKTIQSVYPMFYGISSEDVSVNILNPNKIIVSGKGNKVIKYTTTISDYPFFAFPSSYGELNSVLDANGFTQSWNKINVIYKDVEYYIYYGDKSAATDFGYTFKFN